MDADLDGHLDLFAVNGHIDDTVRNLSKGLFHAQSPNLFPNNGTGQFRDVAAEAGREFFARKVARGLALGDFDRDGDLVDSFSIERTEIESGRHWGRDPD